MGKAIAFAAGTVLAAAYLINSPSPPNLTERLLQASTAKALELLPSGVNFGRHEEIPYRVSPHPFKPVNYNKASSGRGNLEWGEVYVGNGGFEAIGVLNLDGRVGFSYKEDNTSFALEITGKDGNTRIGYLEGKAYKFVNNKFTYLGKTPEDAMNDVLLKKYHGLLNLEAVRANQTRIKNLQTIIQEALQRS